MCDDQEAAGRRNPSPGNDLAGYLALPRTGFPARQRTLGGMSTDVEDLLPFGLGGSAVVVLGLDQSAGFVGRAHITQMICASKLKGSYVLRNPAIAQAVNL